MKKLLYISVPLCSLLGCLIFGEILLAMFSPVPDPYANYKNQKTGAVNQYIRSEFPPWYRVMTEVDLELPGMQRRNTFTTNNMGFRGDYLSVPKPVNEFRIFLVGGSTAECFYIDDSQALNAVLQKEVQHHTNLDLSIRVYNAGKSGDASDDHVSMIAHRIVHLEPDLIIVFSGINDLTRSIYNHDYLHYVKPAQAASSVPVLQSVRSLMVEFPSFATEFQIPRRLYYARKQLSRSDRDVLEEIPLKTDYKSKVALRRSVPVSDEQPRVDVKGYLTNLRSIAGIANAHKAQLVFMTQQTTWNSSVDPSTRDWHWMLYRNGKTYREQIMEEALESLNDAMRRVSRDNSIPLYDLARALPKSMEYFYDDVHFNVKGAALAGTELGRYITPLVKKKAVRQSVKSDAADFRAPS
ncbi:SGNH/GDSL hydrolase family protein [Nitrospira sp. Nam80]